MSSLSELVNTVNQEQELELLEDLAEMVAEEVNEAIRINGKLSDWDKNYTEQQVDNMTLREAKNISPSDIDYGDVADLAKDKIDYNYCGDGE
tara:strand:- start:146 stop:421 length:276 start_codon:yes stop_codon:yes gene_type:complete